MLTTPPRPRRAGRIWSETWRILAAASLGAVLFGVTLVEVENGERLAAVAPWLDGLDLLLGILALALLPFRRRWPLAVVLVLTAFSAVSISSAGTALIALISLSTHRRWRQVAAVALPTVVSGWVYEQLRPTVGGIDLLSNLALSAAVFGLCVAIGYYIGVRRALITSLRERAETAEREQATRIAQARLSERARIAREMHDVLAHRISLVAMHSGALAYRSDLPPAEISAAAEVVRDNAHLALEELRGVLGILRDVEVPAGPELPQPTLADLDDLLEQTRAAGVEVHPVVEVAGLEQVPGVTSRHGYRIVQEALTNARKHAPGEPVDLAVTGGPGDGLRVRVHNSVSSTAAAQPLPASGMGLTGLTERAALSGGTLTYGPDRRGAFVVQAWLPWPLPAEATR